MGIGPFPFPCHWWQEQRCVSWNSNHCYGPYRGSCECQGLAETQQTSSHWWPWASSRNLQTSYTWKLGERENHLFYTYHSEIYSNAGPPVYWSCHLQNTSTLNWWHLQEFRWKTTTKCLKLSRKKKRDRGKIKFREKIYALWLCRSKPRVFQSTDGEDHTGSKAKSCTDISGECRIKAKGIEQADCNSLNPNPCLWPLGTQIKSKPAYANKAPSCCQSHRPGP